MSPLPKIPIQGDIGKLESLSSGTKRSGGTYGEVVQRTPAGRPEGSTTTPQTPQIPQMPETGEAKELYKGMARAEWVRQFWTMMAQRFPNEATSYWASRADLMADDIAGGLYGATPNFED